MLTQDRDDRWWVTIDLFGMRRRLGPFTSMSAAMEARDEWYEGFLVRCVANQQEAR